MRNLVMNFASKNKEFNNSLQDLKNKWKNGINETFGNENYYKNLSSQDKK